MYLNQELLRDLLHEIYMAFEFAVILVYSLYEQSFWPFFFLELRQHNVLISFSYIYMHVPEWKKEKYVKESILSLFAFYLVILVYIECFSFLYGFC
jgi:hypothetical protein